MKSYKEVVNKNLRIQWKRMILTSLGIILAVASATAIFSVLDSLIQFRINQAKYEYGDFQIQVKSVDEKTAKGITEHKYVERYGTVIDAGIVMVAGNRNTGLSGFDVEGARMMGVVLVKGVFPEEEDTIAIEGWFLKTYMPNTDIGSMIQIKLRDKNGQDRVENYKLSGILKDDGRSMSKGVPNAVISLKSAEKLVGKDRTVLIWFKKGYHITEGIKEIKRDFSLGEGRLYPNSVILVLTDPENKIMQKVLYVCGAIVIGIVIFASIIMIYNAINISIMDRVKQFGLLKCIGSTERQIRKLVLREGMIIALLSVLPGIILGSIASIILVTVVKNLVSDIVGDFMPLMVSWQAAAVGIATAFVTIMAASYAPAQKASKVSPIHAVSGSAFARIKKNKTKGMLSNILPIEIVLGIRNVLLNRTSFFITALSLACGLFMFLTFNTFIAFLDTSDAATRPNYTDFSIMSENVNNSGSDEDISKIEVDKVAFLNGVSEILCKRNMNFYCMLSKGKLLPDYIDYCKEKGVQVNADSNNMIIPQEKGIILSYDDKWLIKAKDMLLAGNIDSVLNGDPNSVLAVSGALVSQNAQGISKYELIKPAEFRPGDELWLNTGDGYKSVKVAGILTALPDGSGVLDYFAGIVVNHKVYEQITGKKTFQQMDVKIDKRADLGQIESTLQEIVSNNKSRTMSDWRKQNSESSQLLLAMKIFIYGFVAIIVLIGLLNILNTMSIRIILRTKEIGLLKASGMTQNQLLIMVLFEAFTYGILACVLGTTIGLWASKNLYTRLVTLVFGTGWTVPAGAIIAGILATITISSISVIYPIRRLSKISAVEATTLEI